jgi:hypothetical protein
MVVGMASLNDALMRGTDHVDIVSPIGQPLIAESLTGHAVELPLTGALAFVLYGVSSTSIENEGHDYASFSQVTSVKTLSLYPMYVYLERAVCDETFAYFDVEPDILPLGNNARKLSYIHRKRSEIKQLIKDILQIWFKSLDPETDERIEEYLRRRMMNKRDQMLLVPERLKRASQLTEAMIGGVEPSDDGARGNGRVARGRGYYDQGELRVLFPQREVNSNMVKYIPFSRDVAHDVFRGDIFVSIDGGIDKVSVQSHRDTLLDLHCLTNTPEYIDVVDVLAEAENAFDTKMSLSMLQSAARAYKRRYNIGANKQYVRISSVDTKIVFSEVMGPTDVMDTSLELTVEYKNYSRDLNFKVDQLTVYYRKNNNEFRRDVEDVGNASDFITVPFGITLDRIMERFVYFHDVKYTNRNFMMEPFTMYHMNGHILADRVGVATRIVEDVMTHSELMLKRSYV